MTNSSFDWSSSEQRPEALVQDPLRLTVRPALDLRVPDVAALVPAPEPSGPEGALFERQPDHQQALVSPVLRAAGLDGQDRDRQGQARSQLQERATALRQDLPEDALPQAQGREQARQNPQIPAYFATPSAHREPGARPGASDWVGLYAHEMHGQQQRAGARGIDSRAASAIQRRAAAGLGESYKASELAPSERAGQFGDQLAELSGLPLGGQVSRAVLARLPGSERLPVGRALQQGQQRRAALATQDAHAQELHELEAQLTQGGTPLASRLPADLPADVRKQLELGLNAGPGGFAQAGQALLQSEQAGAGQGGIAVQARGATSGGPAQAPTAGPETQTEATSAQTAPAAAAQTKSEVAPQPASRAAVQPSTETKKADAAHPSDTKKAAESTTKKAATAQAVGKASTKAAKGKKAASKKAGKQEAKAGGASGAKAAGGGAPSFRAVPLAQVPKELDVKPTMQMGASGLFDAQTWKAAVAKADQQAKQAQQKVSATGMPTAAPGGTSPFGKQSLAKLTDLGSLHSLATGHQDAAFGASQPVAPPAVTHAPEAAPKKSEKVASPLSKLGKPVSAAQVKAAAAAERKAAESEMSSFVKGSKGKVDGLKKAKSSIQPTVQAGAKSAQAKVASAAKSASGVISAAASAAIAQAQAAASSAKAKIQADFASTSAQIKATAKSSETELKAANKAAQTTLKTSLTTLNADTDKAFTKAAADARAKAAEVANSATALGNQRASEYAAQALPHMSTWDKIKDGSDYYEKKRQARVDAAHSVGKGYHDQLIKNGNDYAAKVPDGAAKVKTQNQQMFTKFTTALTDQLNKGLDALNKAATQAMQSATQAKTQQLAAVDQQLSQTRSAITQQRGSLSSQVSQQSSSQQAGISKSASSTVSSLSKAADKASGDLEKQISGIQGQLKGKGVPDSATLKTQLAKASSQIAQGVTAAQSSITGGAHKATAGFTEQATGAAQSLNQTAAQGKQSMAQQGAQAAQSAAQVATSASAGFKQLAKGFDTALKQMVKSAKTSADSVTKSFDENATKVITNVNTELDKSTETFGQELTKGMADENSKITSEADKAADKVQPRWKGIVSFVIDVVIAIAVTALVIATGGVAGIILGIVAGAVGGVLSQLAKDALDGNGLSSWQTYAAAALGGAIGGAMGGGGGALTEKLALKVGEKFVAESAFKTAATVSVKFAGNYVTGLASQVVSGYANQAIFKVPFSLSDAFSPTSLLKNVVMTGVGMKAGEYFKENPGVPNRLRSMVGADPLPAGGAHGGSNESDARPPTPDAEPGGTTPRPPEPSGEPANTAPRPTGESPAFKNQAPKVSTEGTTPRGEPSPTNRESPAPSADRNAPETSGAPRTRETSGPTTRRGQPGETQSTPASDSATPGRESVNARGRGTEESVPTRNGPGTEEVPGNNEAVSEPRTTDSDSGLETRGYKPKPGERSTTREEWQQQQHAERIAQRRQEALAKTNELLNQKMDAIPDGPMKDQARQILQQVENLDFGTNPDKASFYSGRKGGVSNRDLALEHVKGGGDAIDNTPGGKALEAMDLYKVFESDTRLADVIWGKASQMYAQGVKGNIDLFVDGASPDRVFGTIERPLVESNADVGRWRMNRNPGDLPDSAPAAPKTPAATPQELSAGLPEGLRSKVPIEVNPDLDSNTVRVKYEHENGVVKSVSIEAGPNATARDIELHAQTVQTMREYMGLQGRVRSALSSLKRLVGLDGTPKLGTKAWEADLELRKLDGIIQDRQDALSTSKDPGEQARLQADIANLEAQVTEHEQTLAEMQGDPGRGYVAADGVSRETLAEGAQFGDKNRPNNFRKSTQDELYKRQPELHDGSGKKLNHDTDAGDLSRNHIIAHDHNLNVELNRLANLSPEEVSSQLEAKGFKPKSDSVEDIQKAFKNYIREEYNWDLNLYVGASGDNSSLGSLMRAARDARAQLSATNSPEEFKDASRQLAEKTVDVPEGKLDGNKLGESDNRAIDEISDLNDKFDEYSKALGALKNGEATGLDVNILDGESNALKSTIKDLVETTHKGSLVANLEVREALIQAVQMELLISEMIMHMNPIRAGN